MKRRSLLGFVLLAGVAASAGRADPKPPPSFLCSLVGDELRLRIGKPHGHELAVLAPGGILYLLAFKPRPDIPEEPEPPFDRFATGHEFGVAGVHTIEGWRLQAGQGRWERVFTRRGVYEFRSAENVASDDVGGLGKFGLATCSVTLK